MAKFTREFWLLPLFGGIALAFAGWEHAPLVWFLFYVCIGCIALCSIYRFRAWAIGFAREINTGRSRYLEAGSEIIVELRVQNKGLLPLPWLAVTDGLPRSIAQTFTGEAGDRTLWLAPGKQAALSYTISNLPRGIHSWEFAQLHSGDPLGLVHYRTRVWGENQLVVYPRTVRLDTWQFFPRRVDGTAATKNSLNHDQSQLVGVREYRPGDRLSLIHWKSSARTGILHSKEFAPLLMDSSLVVLDCAASAWEHNHDPLFEESVIIAASLVRSAWLQRIPIKFHSNHGNYPDKLSVSNQMDYSRFLLHMAGILPLGKRPLSQTIYNDLLTQGINIVVVTPVIGARLQRMLMMLASRGNTVTVIRIDNRPDRPQPRLSPVKIFNLITVNKAEELQTVRRVSS